eukprot:12264407-Alexandrium_andersonii.AAC.1
MRCRAFDCVSSAPRMPLTTPKPRRSLTGGGGSTVIFSNCSVSDATPSALGCPPPASVPAGGGPSP